MVTRRALVALAFVVPLAASVCAQEAINISIVRLIASPAEYNGKLVQVIGYLRLEFEGDAIYLHKDDYDHAILKNGLWIETSDVIKARIDRINNQYVLLEGRFNAHITGHFGGWSGAITDIRRVVAIDVRR